MESRQFTLENVLTLSATKYVGMVGRKLSDYVPKEVIVLDWTTRVSPESNPAKRFLGAVPSDAEVVVGYSTSVAPVSGNENIYLFTIQGTALIPKKAE